MATCAFVLEWQFPGVDWARRRPAITGFVIFSLAGLDFALIPTVLRQDLHQRNAAVAGVVVAELALVAMAAIAGSYPANPDSKMRAGLAVLLPAVGLVVAARRARSTVLPVVATAFAGLALGLGYVGSLHVVNRLAPDEHRGAVASSYFLGCFLANSVPVIGVGVVSTLTTPLTTSLVLAGVVACLSMGTLGWSWRHGAAVRV